MTREGQDGINTDAALMDHNIPVVAYYIDGRYAWTQAEIDLFPRSAHVRIATRASTRDGHFLDRENGDATAAQAAQWAHQRRADGYQWPGIYCSISNQQAVIDACDASHEPLPGWWLAHYDDLDVLPAGALGKQYKSESHDDRSIWADHIPGVDQGDTNVATTDPLPVKRPDGSIPTDGEALGNLYLAWFYGGTSGPSLLTQLAALAGGQAAIAAAMANNQITAAEMQQMIDDAVAKHVQIQGTWTATGDQAAAQAPATPAAAPPAVISN